MCVEKSFKAINTSISSAAKSSMKQKSLAKPKRFNFVATEESLKINSQKVPSTPSHELNKAKRIEKHKKSQSIVVN